MADRIEHTATVRPADGRAPAPTGSEPPLGDLFRQLAQDSATLVRQEVALAKAEIRENVKTVARNATMIAIGAVLALLGGLVLVAFLVMVLGDALWNEYWLGALIVGALFVIIGGIMAKKALGNLKKESLAPEQTIETLKEDKQWLQSEMRSARRDLA
jgi:uncharacterized membrane protein YqjE